MNPKRGNADPVRPVVLTVGRGGVTVPSAVAHLVAPALRVWVTEFGCGGTRGHTRRRVAEEYFVTTPEGALVAPAGLVDRVAGHLRQHRIAAIVDDRRVFAPRLCPDIGALRRCRPDQLPVVRAAAESPRGYHRPRSGAEAIAVTAALLQLFGGARAAVLAPNTATAEAVYRGLVLPLAGQICLGAAVDWTARNRRAVLVAGALGTLNPADWDLVLAVDAHAAVAPSLRPAWRRLGGLKAYGQAAPGRSPTHRERLLFEAAFGAPLLAGADCPPVSVHVTVPPWSPVPADPGDALARKRSTVWNNGPRNRFVAALATAAGAADAAALAAAGAGALGDEPALRRTARPRVAVLIESPEHGRSLLTHLPGWRLVQDEPRPRKPGWGGWNSDAPLREPDGFDRTVLTTMAARRVDALDIDVLVRADGAGSELRLTGFPVVARGPDRPQILVDVADDFDDTAAEDTRSRLRGYRAVGWTIATAPQWATAD